MKTIKIFIVLCAILGFTGNSTKAQADVYKGGTVDDAALYSP
jgi:hypothetical protein